MAGGSRGWVRGRCLGRGSTAAVYLAASISGDGPSFFAAKSAEVSHSAPLQREQHILSALCSPYVVSCLGSDVTAEPDGRVLFNLFMEYVPGGDLAEVVKQHGGLGEDAIRVYTRGVLNGLAYLHSRGIVHCDVKGRNILVGEDGSSVKLADLGCARWVGLGIGDRVVIGGTPLYMAPEVARGEKQGSAADIWALGCTVIEMATGCPPWRDVADPVATIHRIAFSGDVPEFPCSISDDARDFLGRCLNRDPRKRWSAEELLNHPFAKCSEEHPVKRGSPKSTLDQVFWDSWQEELEEEEDGGEDAAGKQPITDSAQGRLLQLLGGSASARQTGANATWEECSWITIRNCKNTKSPTEEEDEPSTSAGPWRVEPPVLAGGGTESAVYSGSTALSSEGYLASNPTVHSFLLDANASHSCITVPVFVCGGGNIDLVETHNFPRHGHKQRTLSNLNHHYPCYYYVLLFTQEIEGHAFTLSNRLSYLPACPRHSLIILPPWDVHIIG